MHGPLNGSLTAFAQFIADLKTARWNAVIPKRAMHVTDNGSSITYLHPTKGYRTVSKRRIEVRA